MSQPVIIILTSQATEDQIHKMSYAYGSYIKVVVDIDKHILAGGGELHYDEERVLLDYGSKQGDLWGGGIDLETETIDYNSMINLRPSQDNSSRDILSVQIRQKFDKIVKELMI